MACSGISAGRRHACVAVKLESDAGFGRNTEAHEAAPLGLAFPFSGEVSRSHSQMGHCECCKGCGTCVGREATTLTWNRGITVCYDLP